MPTGEKSLTLKEKFMKKYYEESKIEIVEFDPRDLISTSDGEGGSQGGNSSEDNNIPSGGGDFVDEGFSNYH